MTVRIVAAIERVLSIFCRFNGHTIDSYTGVCMMCGTQVLPPLDEED